MTALKVGILQTDHVLEPFRTEFGDYDEMFTGILQARARHAGLTLELQYHDVVNGGCPRQAAADAYLITGSRHSVYEDLPWIRDLVNFLQVALAQGRKVVGICFGHQLMAHYFGGQVSEAEVGWGVGVHHSNVVADFAWMQSRPDAVGMLYSHKDQVVSLPDDAEVFLSNDFCPIGGFVRGDQVWTVQGHPEFSRGYSEALMRHRRDMLGEEVFSQGIASLAQDTDEFEVVDWMLEFVTA